MRPEIFYTFEGNSKSDLEKLPRLTVGEVKEFMNFFAGMAMEVMKISREVAERDGLSALLKEFNSLKKWIIENL